MLIWKKKLVSLHYRVYVNMKKKNLRETNLQKTARNELKKAQPLKINDNVKAKENQTNN